MHSSIADFMLQEQSWVVVPEIVWPMNLDYLLTGSLKEKFANPALDPRGREQGAGSDEKVCQCLL